MTRAGRPRVLYRFRRLLKPCPLHLGALEIRHPCLVCGALFLLLRNDAMGFFRISLLASLLHEGGHIAAYLLLFGAWPVISVSVFGLCMKDGGRTAGRAQAILIAAAGPFMNLLLAALWAVRLSYRATLLDDAFFAANLLIGLANLLPVRPLDGGQILHWALLKK